MSAFSQVLSIALLVLAAFALAVQGHRNGESFGNSQVRTRAHSALPTHIQDIINRRSLLHGKDKDGPMPADKPMPMPMDKPMPGYGGGYGGKSWFKGPHRRH